MVLHLMHKVRTDYSNWTAKSSENICSSSGAGGGGGGGGGGARGLLNITKPSIFGGNLSFILYFLPPPPHPFQHIRYCVCFARFLKKKLTPCMTKLWVQVQCFTCFMNNYDFFYFQNDQFFIFFCGFDFWFLK